MLRRREGGEAEEEINSVIALVLGLPLHPGDAHMGMTVMNRARLLIFNAALGPLDYRVPEGMHVEPGSVVVAPLGPRQIVGIVWEEERLPTDPVPDAKLRPLLGVLPVPPLKSELRRLIDEFQAGRDEPATFIERTIAGTVPRDAGAAFYRIAQEALRNISKHGESGPVRVELDGEAGELRLTISDSGPGFDVAEVRARGGLGIVSMHERARLVGGRLHIESTPGEGTTLDLRVPLPPA